MSQDESSSKPLLDKEVPQANLVIGIVLGAVVLAFAFLAGTHYGGSQSQVIESDLAVKAKEESVAVTASTNNQQRILPTMLKSNLMNLDVHWINSSNPIQGPGGGISQYGNNILLAKHAIGSVHRYDSESGKFHQLKIFLPVTNQFKLPAKTQDGRSINPLRYNALEVHRKDGAEYMLAFYGYYDAEKNCRTVRLSEAKLPAGWLEPPNGNVGIELNWRTLFEAAPCLTFTGPNEHITGYQEGGALLRSNNDIYFTTGDMGRDGIANRVPILTQSETSDFGRLYHLDLNTGKIKRLASGLRNTPSLALDSEARLWGVDIGPQGGDELNLLVTAKNTDQKNYGWPYSTFGVDYTGTDTDLRRWPFGDVLGKHATFEKPKFYWPVAITPGGVSYIQDFHPSWDGDLMVAALTGHALLRLSMDDDQIIGQETLPLPARLKSVINAHQRIYFLTDAGWLGYLTPRDNNPTLSPERIAANEVLQQAGCAECHSNPAVPSLAGIWNRDIASQPSIQYSQALISKQGQWTTSQLKAFISNSQTFAPGSLMPNPQLDSSQIDAVIKALKVPYK